MKFIQVDEEGTLINLSRVRAVTRSSRGTAMFFFGGYEDEHGWITDLNFEVLMSMLNEQIEVIR